MECLLKYIFIHSFYAPTHIRTYAHTHIRTYAFLNMDIPNVDIFINGFLGDPFRSDKPENMRNGGVCLYFKEHSPIKERKNLELLPETIIAEIKLNRKKMFFVLSYCRPNLSSAYYDQFTDSIEKIYECINKENPSVTILTGDFNARSLHFGKMTLIAVKVVFLIIFFCQII